MVQSNSSCRAERLTEAVTGMAGYVHGTLVAGLISAVLCSPDQQLTH
jgi:hypothetical protein